MQRNESCSSGQQPEKAPQTHAISAVSTKKGGQRDFEKSDLYRDLSNWAEQEAAEFASLSCPSSPGDVSPPEYCDIAVDWTEGNLKPIARLDTSIANRWTHWTDKWSHLTTKEVCTHLWEKVSFRVVVTWLFFMFVLTCSLILFPSQMGNVMLGLTPGLIAAASGAMAMQKWGWPSGEEEEVTADTMVRVRRWLDNSPVQKPSAQASWTGLEVSGLDWTGVSGAPM